MNNAKASPHLPLKVALAWIVGSMLVVNGICYSCLKLYLSMREDPARRALTLVRSIVQTGPQKEALKTEYLAEILGVCVDYPQTLASYNLELLRQKLLNSPLISQARISAIKPNMLYIDYTVRQPLAFLADFDNVAIDKQGYAFPFAPFFSPKILPEIYLGLSPFGSPAEDSDKPLMQWGSCLKGKHLDLALDILSYVTDPKVSDFFHVTWIDVSNAFSNSCGTREIVLITEDSLYLKKGGNDIHRVLPRMLRLSTKDYPQQLGNYLKLRDTLLEEDRKNASLSAGEALSRRIIDFRIPHLAFIEESTGKVSTK